MSRFLRAYLRVFHVFRMVDELRDSPTSDPKKIRKIISMFTTLLSEESAMGMWQEEGEKTARSYRLSVV
jgi:hypothetical protein